LIGNDFTLSDEDTATTSAVDPSQPDLSSSARLLDRPILVIGCNRSGTTLIFRNLSEHPKTWGLYEESQHIFYRHYPIDPEMGDRLVDPPSSEIAASITRAFYREAHNKEVFKDLRGLRLIPRKLLQRPTNRFYKRPPLRLVEKTPANSLRIPFLFRLFPDARIVFVVRRAEDTISSLMEGWKNWSNTGSGSWVYGQWHYLVPPGWQQWKGRALAEICAFQWVESNRVALEDLEAHCPGRYLFVRYEEAVAGPAAMFEKIRTYCELDGSRHFDHLALEIEKRVFTHGGSAPRVGKWRDLHGDEIDRARPIFQELSEQLYPDQS
jgi:hypothetical protein